MTDSRRFSLGSLLMVGLPGKDIDDSTLALIKDDGVHNFILFKRNVETPAQLRKLNESLLRACVENGLPRPLISIDQEGGSVTRLPLPFSQFPDQRELADSGDCQERLLDYARKCATELKDVGVNMNLAPVLDICPVGKDFFMERRSLGDDPRKVSLLGSLVISEMQKCGVAACAKHFPGLGQAVLDPHLELPVVSASRERMEQFDLLPFEAARDANVAAFMTSHTIYEGLDAKRPATLSPVVLRDILRTKIGYEGMVVTDDLEMGAIEKMDSIQNAALASFVAGADLLLICKDHDKIRKTIQVMEKARRDNIIGAADVDLAIMRQGRVRDIYA